MNRICSSVSYEKPSSKGLGSIIFVFLLFWWSQSVCAQSAIAAQAEHSHLTWQDREGTKYSIPLMNTRLDVNVNGLLYEAKLVQSFKNDTDQWIEANYVFPLPEEGAVYGMLMKIGERVIKGEIQEKQKARETYIHAKRQGKRTALVDQERSNLFTTQVANIAPGATIEIELKIHGMVAYRDDQFELRFPLTSTPRYIPGQALLDESRFAHLRQSLREQSTSLRSDVNTGWALPTSEVPDAHRISPLTVTEHELNGLDSHRALVKVKLDSGLPVDQVKSPSHPIRVEALGPTQSALILNENGLVKMDRDMVISWRLKASQQPQAAVFTSEEEQGHYTLLMLMPPNNLSDDVILPRSLSLVVDTSGSMAGESIVQAKAAVRQALNGLRPSDHFNLIQFNSRTEALFPTEVEANELNLQAARRYVDSLVADGGTEMSAALSRALNQRSQSGKVRQVVFITDGSVGNEKALFQQIERELGNARLFTVGIGSAPNNYFMRKAAEFGRGEHLYIAHVAEVENKLNHLLQRLERPVLSQLDYGFDVEVDAYPGRIQDLYAGEPLVLVARSEEAPEQFQIRAHQLAGHRSEQAIWQKTLHLDGHQSAIGLSRYWARQKIEHHLDSRVTGVPENEVKEKVLALALEYQLSSPYTSFVAVDVTPVRAHDIDIQSQQVPQLRPAGSGQSGMPFPGTATGSFLYLSLGGGGLLIALGFLIFRALKRGETYVF